MCHVLVNKIGWIVVAAPRTTYDFGRLLCLHVITTPSRIACFTFSYICHSFSLIVADAAFIVMFQDLAVCTRVRLVDVLSTVWHLAPSTAFKSSQWLSWREVHRANRSQLLPVNRVRLMISVSNFSHYCRYASRSAICLYVVNGNYCYRNYFYCCITRQISLWF